MKGTEAFTKVPLEIDLFISHPIFSKTVSSPLFMITSALLTLTCALYLYRAISTRTRARARAILLVISFTCLVTSIVLSPMIKRARKPTGSMIIAAIIDDKTILNYGFFKQYYFIVDINREKIGVITNKDIYSMSQYKKYSTFDYTLYTYNHNGKSVMYNFCRPEFKVKVERGNCQ